MEEELNEDELEERLYAMIHHVDETQANVNQDQQKEISSFVETTSKSTLKRYWRTSGENTPTNTRFAKVNSTKDSSGTANSSLPEPKHEKQKSPIPPLVKDSTEFDISDTSDIKVTILENDELNNVVNLESSDEDEVIEVQLPPKPTITIDSSDDELTVVPSLPPSLASTAPSNNLDKKRAEDRDSTSPVLSVVSSVSDEFIRGDCIALKISSRHQDNPKFDFSLHGSDLIDTEPQKKKKKKSKDREKPISSIATSTPEKIPSRTTDECFATPKNKAKSKKSKNKNNSSLFTVTPQSVPNPDVYDSDSNNSLDHSRKQKSYVTTEKTLPSFDVYESDSSHSEYLNTSQHSDMQNNSIIEPSKDDLSAATISSSDLALIKKVHSQLNDCIDLTDSTKDDRIEENIVMANVTGFKEPDDYSDKDEPNIDKDPSKLGSTNVPAILFEDLDFDNMKGKHGVHRHKYSMSLLRQEMDKFYNESWGGENFNHREIQKTMSRDKSLWEIDPKDRMPTPTKRKTICNYCNRVGHRDETCRQKPPVCHMCGVPGHYEPRCPHKICVNCGSPNYMYSTVCRNCSGWSRIRCSECRQMGHPASHCPDLWRRYHNTISNNGPLIETPPKFKKHNLYCSGCTRRGHLVHNCRISIPFSGLPIYSPYVTSYKPFYPTAPYNQTEHHSSYESRPNKRASKSPTAHESHVNKKRNLSAGDATDYQQTKDRYQSQNSNEYTKQFVNTTRQVDTPQPRKLSETDTVKSTSNDIEKAADYIPIFSNSRDNKGQMIQDNEVSNTSDIITSARIYVSNDIIELLKTAEGEKWLTENMNKHNVEITHSDLKLFLIIKGKVCDQEAFQTALRDWTSQKAVQDNDKQNVVNTEQDDQSYLSDNIPKNRNNVLRKLKNALMSLKNDYGDPKAIYKELKYLQNNHNKLMKERIISPKRLNNSKNNINEILKKLNMVLLGQAGLADGSTHLSELYMLHKKLTQFRQKNIPLELRKEIGQHYHCIFTALPRDDYLDLLDKYYLGRNNPGAQIKNRSYNFAPKFIERKLVNPVAIANKNRQLAIEQENQQGSTLKQSRVLQKARNKLSFYHKRLMRVNPVDAVHKKTRLELVNKLIAHISSLDEKAKVTSKNLKKMKKIQEQANRFLNNV